MRVAVGRKEKRKRGGIYQEGRQKGEIGEREVVTRGVKRCSKGE